MKRIAISMIEGLASTLSAFIQSELGDLTWSARNSKLFWLKCDGQAISRATYADLFTEIGTAFGTGDGSTTFNLPDGRGRALIGVGTGASLTARALAAKGGAETHVLTEAEMPSHTHPAYNASNGNGGSQILVPTSGGNMASNNVTAATGGGGAHNNMQPWLAANLFIFAGV